MALKVSLILAVYFLCGFLAVIQPAYSIRCYRKITKNNEVINNDGQVDCRGEGDDGCGTMTFTYTEQSSSFNIMIKNCTRSALDCDQNAVCERARASLAKDGATMSDCSLSCCNSDYCNAPATTKDEPVKKHGTRGGNDIEEKLVKLISSRF
ncbi:hypothetical protein ACROYT_G037081 [Oculina patagonica]